MTLKILVGAPDNSATSRVPAAIEPSLLDPYPPTLDDLASAVCRASGSNAVTIVVTSPAGLLHRGHWGSNQSNASRRPRELAHVVQGRASVEVQFVGPDNVDDRMGALIGAAAVQLADRDTDSRAARGSVRDPAAFALELAQTIGRTVVVQDSRGQEFCGPHRRTNVGCAAATPIVLLSPFGDGCRTWPVLRRGVQVGRIWVGQGNTLTVRDLVLLAQAREVLALLLAE